ncbi:HD domain-containing phosphohydrolase [Ferriphaselus sp. R-1]|uniref:HD-GYP domain-containing protein n=1 Tax=Ferriphaselus sp. R-1 TaxID=1485544 RepID=UPI00068EA5A3|nr:HD domain-containing phosphohydrolase [Ferriphaselus sp. R-1]
MLQTATLHDLLGQLRFRINANNRPVREAQLEQRLKIFPVMVFGQMGLEPLVVWLFWGTVPHQTLLTWLGVFWLLHAREIVFWRQVKARSRELKDLRYISRHFTFLSLAVGGMWGLGAILFFSDSETNLAFLISIMLGLVAGSTDSNPSHPPSLYIFPFMVLPPLIIRLAWSGGLDHQLLAAMLLFFMCIVLSAGHHLSGAIYASLRQDAENIRLVQTLTEQKQQLSATQLQLQQANELLRQDGDVLMQKVEEGTTELSRRMDELNQIKEATLLAYVSLASTRDNETGNHIRRTQHYVHRLARHLQRHPRFQGFLTDEVVELLPKVAPLHDIGKVGIPDRILLKPDKLTPEEFEIMKTHALLGGEAIAAAEARLEVNSSFLQVARQIATSHHEKWDGSGYPHGLSGEAIPIPARLMALADVYDALTTRRVYKPPFSHEQACAIILDGKGTHFDPDIVEAFLDLQPEFQAIATEFQD